MRRAFESWLAQHCHAVDSVSLGAVLLARPGGLQALCTWPAGQMVPPALATLAAAALAGRSLAQQSEGRGHAQRQLVAQPLVVSTGAAPFGAVVLALASPTPASAEQLAQLEASLAAFCAGLRSDPGASGFGADATEPSHPAQRASDQPAPASQALDAAALVLSLAQSAFEQTSFRAGALALLSRLAATLRCDRVSLGFRAQGLTRVLLDSDGGEVDPDRGAGPDLAAAMDEAMDHGNALAWPQDDADAPRVLAAHQHLARAQALAAVASVPLAQAGVAHGALVLERGSGPAFSAADLALLEDLSRTVAAWLIGQHATALPWHRRALQRTRQAWTRLGEPGHGRYKLAAAVLGLMLGAAAMVPMGHELSAPARLEGRSQRVVAAPSDGFLRQVHVRPGDSVQAGQLLLEFAGEDLALERQRLAAEVAGQEAAVGDAMSRQDRSQLAVASAKLAELQAQLALAEQRLARARVTAPFDGVVLQGDLGQTLGAPVKRGDALLTLAPADGYRAIVEVEDADIDLVRQGQGGQLVLSAHPGRVLPATVTRITPLATVAEGRNVFEVEVRLAPEANSPDLRPGMRGVARLKVGERPLAALWTRDAVAWLRLATWRWWG